MRLLGSVVGKFEYVSLTRDFIFMSLGLNSSGVSNSMTGILGFIGEEGRLLGNQVERPGLRTDLLILEVVLSSLL